MRKPFPKRDTKINESLEYFIGCDCIDLDTKIWDKIKKNRLSDQHYKTAR